MEVSLLNIKEDVNRYINIISNLLNVDVGVVDKNMFRVTGTGLYKNIDGVYALGSVYKEFYIASNETSASANKITDIGNNKVTSVTLDDDIKEKVTLIKMDIEGSEEQALIGAINHIKKDTPKLLIAVYHNHDDLWKLPKLIDTINPNYKYYLRYFGNKYYPTEVVLMALPK